MKIETMVTTFQKNEEEISSLLAKNNIEGEPLVGDQNGESGAIKLSYKNGFYKLILLSSIGVSKSRNSLLRCADSDIVTFADDNISFEPGYLKIVQNAFAANPKAQAIRFNLYAESKIKDPMNLKKNKLLSRVKYYQISCFGIFFRLEFLTKNSLSFNPMVGPGMRVENGEDALFLNDFYKAGGKILQDKRYIGRIIENENAINEETLKGYFYSLGFVASKLFGKWSYVMGFFHLICFHEEPGKRASFIEKIKAYNRGIYDGKYY